MTAANLCIFCFKSPNDLSPWCVGNPGWNCQYGMHHEFIVDEVRPLNNARQGKKIDKQVCTKCNMHIKNPISNSNGCTHEYL